MLPEKEKSNDPRERYYKQYRTERLLLKLFAAALFAAFAFFLHKGIFYLLKPEKVKGIEKVIEEKRQYALYNIEDADIRREYLQKLERAKEEIEKYYPSNPNGLSIVQSAYNPWLKYGAYLLSFLIAVSPAVILFLLLKRQVIPFVFPVPEKEMPIPLGEYDDKLFQPEKWGVDKEYFKSLFKNNKEFNFENFVRMYNKRLKRKVSQFDGSVKEFNPDEVNETIGKLLNLIFEKGKTAYGNEIEDEQHFRSAVGLALFHHIGFWFGHIPTGTVNAFIKDPSVKKVLAEYHKEKGLRHKNEVFAKADTYLKFLHTAKILPYDVSPEDMHLFGNEMELSVLEYLKRKYKTLPEE